MAKKKQRIGVCHNPACPMCDVEQFFDEKQEFKCSCCPEPLDEINADSQDSDGGAVKKIPWKMIGIICGVTILVAAVIWFFLVRKSGQEPQPVTEETVVLHLNYNDISLNTGDTDYLVADITSNLEIGEVTVTFRSDNPSVATVDEAGVIKANHEGSATISTFATTPNGTVDTAFVYVLVKDYSGTTPASTPKEKNADAVGYNTFNLGWGSYSGPMKDGKPHGNRGKIKVTKEYTLELHDITGSKLSVLPGETIITKYENGRLVAGELIHKDGSSTLFENH